MIHVVLMAERGREDDFSCPDWQALITSESLGMAHNVYKRCVSQCKAIMILWVEVSEDGMVAVRGFLNVSEDVDFQLEANTATVSGSAMNEINRRVVTHRNLKGDYHHAASQRPGSNHFQRYRIA